MWFARSVHRRATGGRQRHPSAPRRPVAAPDQDAPRRWRERRWFAFGVRLIVLVAPLVLSFVVAMWLSGALGVPESLGERIARWLGIAAVSTVVLMLAQRMMRHVLPLSALLSLTLVFPDAAPSRFRIALRSVSARGLERSLVDARNAPDTDTPQRAAERLLVLIGALSRHDRLTRGHSERVRAYSLMIGEELGLDPAELDRLRWAGLLHDVGKLHVPAEILNKPGRLTDDEYAIVRQHTVHGARLTAGLREWLGDAVDAVDQHHERWAGGGYPYGLRGRSITRAARIVSVADAFDVMTSARSYKKPIPAAAARSELERCAGSQFDPEVVRAMLSVSLGALWWAMGPLSWAAQLRLFPRQVAQATTTMVTSAAVAVSVAITAITAVVGTTGDVVEVASLPPVAADVESEPADNGPLDGPLDGPLVGTTVLPAAADPAAGAGPGSIPTSDLPTVAAAPASLPSSTGVASTTTVESDAALPPTEGDVVIVRPPTTIRADPPAAPSPTVQLPTTIAAPGTTTVAPTTTLSTTTVPSTTAPSTTPQPAPQPQPQPQPRTTAPPGVPGLFTVGSSGPGDVAARAVLPLQLARAPLNASIANYDVDRNTDPGSTIVRDDDQLIATDPSGVQAWAFPDSVDAIPRSVTLTLYVSAAGPVAAGDELHVRAGVFRCNPARRNCDRVRFRTVVLQAPPPGVFVPVVFDLSAPGLSIAPTGHGFELRFAVPADSDADAWIAYDATDAPATVTLGP